MSWTLFAIATSDAEERMGNSEGQTEVNDDKGSTKRAVKGCVMVTKINTFLADISIQNEIYSFYFNYLHCSLVTSLKYYTHCL